MAKLKLNDDGTVTLPLLPTSDGAARQVVLPEPSMRQLARIHSLANEADEKLPEFDALTEEPTGADVRRVNDQLRARTVMMYSDDSPHGRAMLAVIALLTDENYTEDDLPGWVMGPSTLRQILAHFQAPLPGPASVPDAPTA